MDIYRYWKTVDAKIGEIADEWPYVVGVDDPTRGLSIGCPTQVSREDAARLIVENKARLATAKEVEAELKRAKAASDKLREVDRERAVRNLLFPVAQEPKG